MAQKSKLNPRKDMGYNVSPVFICSVRNSILHCKNYGSSSREKLKSSTCSFLPRIGGEQRNPFLRSKYMVV
ncbi:hypothetical protein K1719_025992 [Acacia pycnantha]|nr:hypothetical protein K1719_044782 [Acacia pycnantha]KAI9096813.1 hypothetical protein K1719_025992 [Acacia pycnantha]